nr:WxL domain-containing protein [Neobacillus sp. Marseille-Q6967]
MNLTRYLLLGAASILSISLFTQEIATASTATSKALIKFKEDSSVPPVLDPDNPEVPYNPEDPSNPGTENPPTRYEGPLSLDYVSNLNFGEQTISLTKQTYNATTLKPFIQVTDKRGISDGWKVTVSASPFISDNSKHQLTGVSIDFAKGETDSNSLGDSFGAPTTLPFTLSTDNIAVNVVTAQSGKGRGSWITKWFPTQAEATDNDSVKLTVPGGNMKAEPYTSTLTWTLSSAP